MKPSTSISISILALGIALGVGWYINQSRTDTPGNPVTQSTEREIPADPPSAVPVPERMEGNREAAAKFVAAEFIALAKEREANLGKNSPPDAAIVARYKANNQRMESLDSDQLKLVIADLLAATELNAPARQDLLALVFFTFAGKDPQAALTSFAACSDLFKDGGHGERIVSSSLESWGGEDPVAAIGWVRENEGKFPGFVTADAKGKLIDGAMKKDPNLALKLSSGLGLEQNALLFSYTAVSAAKTPTERTASLAALREYLTTIQDETIRRRVSGTAMNELALGAAMEGFESGSNWIAGAKYTAADLMNFPLGLSNRNFAFESGETVRWIEWLEKTYPGTANPIIDGLVSLWAGHDHPAVAKWLDTVPDGPVKNLSIRAFAEVVSRSEPETAVKWAMTLPPGNDRDATLKNIYKGWPKEKPEDAEAAEAFAREHGIK